MGVATGSDHSWANHRVLVTGAAGFLGRAASEQLVAAGATVAGLDIAWDDLPARLQPTAVTRIDGDVRDAEDVIGAIGRQRIDTVIHLAAQALVGPAIDDPTATFSHNVAGTWVVLEACRATPNVTSIVVASSDKAYGDWAGRPYREDMALRPDHPYDASKAAADLLAHAYGVTYGLPVAITRCGNLYGGGDLNWTRIVPGTVRSILQGERPVIRSDGTFVRDYLHVQDAADGVLRLAATVRAQAELRGEAFNFASRARASVLDVVDLILREMGSDLVPIIEARELKEIREQRLTAAKSRRVLHWRPGMSLARGLREAVAWYRAHRGDFA